MFVVYSQDYCRRKTVVKTKEFGFDLLARFFLFSKGKSGCVMRKVSCLIHPETCSLRKQLFVCSPRPFSAAVLVCPFRRDRLVKIPGILCTVRRPHVVGISGELVCVVVAALMEPGGIRI